MIVFYLNKKLKSIKWVTVHAVPVICPFLYFLIMTTRCPLTQRDRVEVQAFCNHRALQINK